MSIMERSNSKPKLPGNPFDINGQHFNPDMYLQKLFKDYSLKEIMEQEEGIMRDTQTLHSEMQTLVYENYNKFISATDTIRKMKTDFKQMETEMDLLGKNIDSITSFSDQISGTLLDTRQQISKLSGIHSLLKRMQFLFELPQKLKTLMEEENYHQAVEDYVHTAQVLECYSHLESFQGIQSDCEEIISHLKGKLLDKIESKTASAKEVAESVKLLLLLNVSPESLYKKYLSHASFRLDGHIELLKNDDSIDQDMIEFVDSANQGFLCDLCLIVTSYKEMFFDGDQPWRVVCEGELDDWINSQMSALLDCVKSKALTGRSTPVLVRALDRLFNSLASLTSVLSFDFTPRVVELAGQCGERECARRRTELSDSLAESLREVRQTLTDQPTKASDLVRELVRETVAAANLHVSQLSDFRLGELPLTKEKKLQESVEQSMKQILIIGFLRDLLSLARSFTSTSVSLSATLVLAKMCLEFANLHIHDLLKLIDGAGSLEEENLCKEMLSAAQELGDHYVKMQGNIIGQMIRKSVETRDWAHSLEPRNVRPVMRRVLEELASTEPLASLFEDLHVQPPGSGSRHHARSSTGLSSWADPGYTLNKLFSDKIEIFTPIEFTKSSILTGIIKIILKTHLECVRLKIFNKFGLQQIQVDIHYLQQHLWRYAPDDSLINTLLNDILESTKQRCTEPVLMVPSVVDVLTERG